MKLTAIFPNPRLTSITMVIFIVLFMFSSLTFAAATESEQLVEKMEKTAQKTKELEKIKQGLYQPIWDMSKGVDTVIDKLIDDTANLQDEVKDKIWNLSKGLVVGAFEKVEQLSDVVTAWEQTEFLKDLHNDGIIETGKGIVLGMIPYYDQAQEAYEIFQLIGGVHNLETEADRIWNLQEEIREAMLVVAPHNERLQKQFDKFSDRAEEISQKFFQVWAREVLSALADASEKASAQEAGLDQFEALMQRFLAADQAALKNWSANRRKTYDTAARAMLKASRNYLGQRKILFELIADARKKVDSVEECKYLANLCGVQSEIDWPDSKKAYSTIDNSYQVHSSLKQLWEITDFAPGNIAKELETLINKRETKSHIAVIRGIISQWKAHPNKLYNRIISAREARRSESLKNVSGKKYIKSIKIHGVKSPMHIAADDFTAMALNNRRRIPFSVSTHIDYIIKKQCECMFWSDASYSWSKAVKTLMMEKGSELLHQCNEVSIEASSGLQVDESSGFITGSAPGEYFVQAKATSGIDRVVYGRDKNRMCRSHEAHPFVSANSTATTIYPSINITTKPITTPKYAVHVYQVKDVRYRADGEELPSKIDLFSKVSLVKINYEALVASPKGEAWQAGLPAVELKTEVKGSGITFKKENYGKSIRLTRTEPGGGILTLYLLDENGKQKYRHDIPVTSNRIRSEIQLPEDSYYHNNIPVVPAGKSFILWVIAEGDADMHDYHVAWDKHQYSSGDVKLDAEITGFKRQGGRWVSENRVVFREFPERLLNVKSQSSGSTDKLRNMFQAGPFRAAVVRKSDGKTVDEASLSQVAGSLPVIKDIDFAVATRPIHLFVPMTLAFFNKVNRLALTADFEGFGKKFIPLTVVDTYIAGTIPVRVNAKEARLEMWGSSVTLSDNAKSFNSNANTGEASVVARLTRRAAREYGWFLDKPRVLATLPVTLNKVEVGRKSADKNALHQLKLYGPAPMSSFTAKWHGSKKASTPVTSTSYGGVSEVDLGQHFIGVTLNDDQGAEIMRFSHLDGFFEAAPLPPLAIRIEMPEIVPAGEKVRIEARIDNVKQSDNCFCDWNLSGNAGNIIPRRTTMQYISNGRGYCSTMMEVNKNESLIGQKPSVEVKLTRVR